MEEQIREHEKAIIKLKRARNALLNVSTLPPELLGKIFEWNVTLKDDFGGLVEGSHNFLLVCHHWLEVALGSPGVWSFWGNTIPDWTRWYRRSGTAPLDLVVYTSDGGSPLDVALHDALRDRATRDTIRRVHLRSQEPVLLTSILSSLTVACEGVRSNTVESLIMWGGTKISLDVSDFFARHRFPKLRQLKLEGSRIASWDLLMSRTSVLTTLSLCLDDSSPTPTTPQLLSILASNPTLRKLSLSGYAIPRDGGGNSSLRVPLQHLKNIMLDGGMQHVLGLLHRLDHPGNMDDLDITLSGCTVTDIQQTIGPYLRDHLRRRDSFHDGLGLRVSQFGNHVILYAGDVYGLGFPSSGTHANWFAGIGVGLEQAPGGSLEKVVLDFIAHTPQDKVVRFDSLCGLASVGDVSAQFPNLRELHIDTGKISLPDIFPESKPGGDEKVLPSLQHIFLGCVDGGDWSLLTTFLARRASSGDRLRSLTILDSHVCPEVQERIRSMVQEFYVESIGRCPVGTCGAEFAPNA